jgi:hypothetical protein
MGNKTSIPAIEKKKPHPPTHPYSGSQKTSEQKNSTQKNK